MTMKQNIRASERGNAVVEFLIVPLILLPLLLVLTRAAGIETMPRARSHTAQQGALQQTLRVNHGIVGLRPHALTKSAYFTPGRGAPELPPPAPHGYRYHLTHTRMQRHQRRIGLLHDPVDQSIGNVMVDIAHNRQVVHDIAKRRGLDE